jgi:hypothetical protein
MSEPHQSPQSADPDQKTPKSSAFTIASVLIAGGLGGVTYLLSALGIHKNPIGTVLVGLLALLCVSVLLTSTPRLRGDALNITLCAIGALVIGFVFFVVFRLGEGMSM